MRWLVKSWRRKFGSLFVGAIVLFAADFAVADELAPEDTLACMESVSDAPKVLHAALHSKCVLLTGAYCHRQKGTQACYPRFDAAFEQANTVKRGALLDKIERAEAAGDDETLKEAQRLLEVFQKDWGSFECPAELKDLEGACGYVVQVTTMLTYYHRKSMSDFTRPPHANANRGPSIVKCLSAVDPLVGYLRGNMQDTCLTSAELFCRKQKDVGACFASFDVAMADHVREILKLLPNEIDDNFVRRRSYRKGLARLQGNKWDVPCKGAVAELCGLRSQFLATQNAFWLARQAKVTGHLE